MTKIIAVVKIALLMIFILIPPLCAQFTDDYWNARPLALGNAFVGVIGGCDSAFWNPAGTLRQGMLESQFTIGKPVNKVKDKEKNIQSFSMNYGWKNGMTTAGLWWTNSSIEDTTDENVYAFNYARRIWKSEEDRVLSAGVNLKHMSRLNEEDERRKKADLGADIGFLFNYSKEVSFGAVFQNFNRPNFEDGNDEKLHGKIDVGTVLRFNNATMMTFEVGNIGERHNAKIRGGIERSFFNEILTLRAGGNSDRGSGGVAIKGAVSKVNISFEYAYLYPYRLNEFDRIHLATIRIDFGEAGGESFISASEVKERKKEEKTAESELTKDMESEIEQISFLLGPEDVVDIDVKDHPELSHSATIDSFGYLKLPYVGNFDVKGMSPDQLKNKLREIYSDFYVEVPLIEVVVREYNSRVVYVVGSVRYPGKYSLTEKPLTVRDIVVSAGLPTERAANWRSFVVRQTEQGPRYIHINLNKILYRGRLENNIQLQTGDIVYVPMGALDSLATFIGRIFGPIIGISRSAASNATF